MRDPATRRRRTAVAEAGARRVPLVFAVVLVTMIVLAVAGVGADVAVGIFLAINLVLVGPPMLRAWREPGP